MTCYSPCRRQNCSWRPCRTRSTRRMKRRLWTKPKPRLVRRNRSSTRLLNISKLESATARALTSGRWRCARSSIPCATRWSCWRRKKGLTLRIVDSSQVEGSDPRLSAPDRAEAADQRDPLYRNRAASIVGARRNGDSARIEVWDTGPGDRRGGSELGSFRRSSAGWTPRRATMTGWASALPSWSGPARG